MHIARDLVQSIIESNGRYNPADYLKYGCDQFRSANIQLVREYNQYLVDNFEPMGSVYPDFYKWLKGLVLVDLGDEITAFDPDRDDIISGEAVYCKKSNKVAIINDEKFFYWVEKRNIIAINGKNVKRSLVEDAQLALNMKGYSNDITKALYLLEDLGYLKEK